MLTRSPVVAGMFYSASPEKLKQQIKSCFESRLGPGGIGKASKKKIFGLIVPHAGYIYSGPCAAWAYKELAESKQVEPSVPSAQRASSLGCPKTIILLGLSHQGLGTSASVWLGSDWETPLGKIKINRELGEKIADGVLFDKDPDSHLEEHSIEVQLPFLQHIYKNLPEIVPITISAPLELCEKLGARLGTLIKNKNAVVIASSDFTHYGASYGYLPFGSEKAKEKLKDLDSGAIDKIAKLDCKGFIDYLKKTKATICGAAPILVLMAALKELGVKKGKLLKYYSSGDISGDYSSSVGYASIKFNKNI